MKIPFVDLKSQYKSLETEIDQAIKAVINDTAFIRGKYVQAFEEQFADFIGLDHCIGCANGTDALEIALQALEIGPGDEVIVPANTWISTAEAVTTAGAQVVFVDNHPELYTINTELIEEKITEKTKAIIPVHLYGLAADMESICDIAKRHQLLIIEDTAQAHGAEINGQIAGTFGDIATYSFFPGKNLGAYGDAGAMLTNNKELATRCRMIANHGRLGKFDHELEGRNSRLDGLQAAILSVKLPHLKDWTTARIENAKYYTSALQSFDLQLPIIPDNYKHVFHLYVVQVSNRESLREQLAEQGVATGIHYPIPLPLLKAYEYLGHQPEDYPVSSKQMNRILSLPMFPELTEQQMDFVVSKINELI